MKCPFCENENVELVELWSENFQRYGPAVECLDCGLRGPVPDKEDTIEEEDELAIRFWNEITFVKQEE